MQKLDLGVDYDTETQADSATEPLTAEPQTTSASTVSSAASTTPTPAKDQVLTSSSARPTTKPITPMKKTTAPITIMIAVIAIVAGSATGVGAFKLQSQSDPLVGGAEIQQIAGDNIKNGDIFGNADPAQFTNPPEGYLQIGGLEGEGTHHLVRPGGADQTVYLVSTVTDLDKFDGMMVKVWGDTYKGQKAGWLMDVVRVQVINTQGTPPSEE